jgi:hypothetical protein
VKKHVIVWGQSRLSPQLWSNHESLVDNMYYFSCLGLGSMHTITTSTPYQWLMWKHPDWMIKWLACVYSHQNILKWTILLKLSNMEWPYLTMHHCNNNVENMCLKHSWWFAEGHNNTISMWSRMCLSLFLKLHQLVLHIYTALLLIMMPHMPMLYVASELCWRITSYVCVFL